VTIQAWDRVGLLRDLTTKVSEQSVNIASVVSVENEDGTHAISLTLYTTGIGQLGRLFSKIEGVRGVIGVSRSSAGTPAPVAR
jgi:GTP pyrophosphokinase